MRQPASRPAGRRRPAVVAHRGASDDEAEHTLAAYLRAVEDGADALECDVRLTRDGVLVCVHDRRVDRTSSGRGVLSTLELADLEDLDFGSWRVSEFAGECRPGRLGSDDDAEAPDHDRTRVLTLSRLLEMVIECGRLVPLAVETKHPTRYAGLVELRLVELLGRYGLLPGGPAGGPATAPVRVMSFAASSLRRVHSLAPALPTVLLMRRVPIRYRDGSRPPRVHAMGPSMSILRAHPGYVRRVQDRGGQVHVWTVDEPADVKLVTDLGVDAIITNRPAAVRRLLDRPAHRAGYAERPIPRRP